MSALDARLPADDAAQLLGAVQLTLAVLPGMRERKFGHIVNISSGGVQAKAPRFSRYVASKAALDAFSDCVTAEVRHDNVHFTTIFMPLVRTPMIAPTTFYEKVPALTPEEAGDLVCQAILHRLHRVQRHPALSCIGVDCCSGRPHRRSRARWTPDGGGSTRARFRRPPCHRRRRAARPLRPTAAHQADLARREGRSAAPAGG
jgi:NAD(P)-dependent dehydrogenase (short-subunit alcohol dehydrogenase family)